MGLSSWAKLKVSLTRRPRGGADEGVRGAVNDRFRVVFLATHAAVPIVYILFLVSDRSRRTDIRVAHVQRAYRTCVVASKAFGFHETRARGRLRLE
jgi:hypothetical protein